MTEMFHITHSALHVGLTTTLQRYNQIYRSDMFNILSFCGTSISFACNPVSRFTELVFLAGLFLRNMTRGTDVINIFRVLLTFPIFSKRDSFCSRLVVPVSMSHKLSPL